MKKLYITDLDGTLLDSEARLTSKSKEYINRAISDGANFTVATARTFATVMDLFKDINLTLPLVLMNGVMIFDPLSQKTIKSHPISSSVAVKILETFLKHGHSPLVYYDKGDCLEIKYCDQINQYQNAYVNKRNHTQGKLFSYTPVLSVGKNDNVIYFVTLDLYDKIVDLYNDLKSIESINVAFYRDNYTDCYFLEIFSADVSKASGLSEIREFVNADNVIAFGDNLNDIDMFNAADEAYAVSNACNELKKVSTAVIGSNNEDSVAKFIYYHHTESK